MSSAHGDGLTTTATSQHPYSAYGKEPGAAIVVSFSHALTRAAGIPFHPASTPYRAAHTVRTRNGHRQQWPHLQPMRSAPGDGLTTTATSHHPPQHTGHAWQRHRLASAFTWHQPTIEQRGHAWIQPARHGCPLSYFLEKSGWKFPSEVGRATAHLSLGAAHIFF